MACYNKLGKISKLNCACEYCLTLIKINGEYLYGYIWLILNGRLNLSYIDTSRYSKTIVG